MGYLTTCASEAQVFGGKFYLVISPIHPPLGGSKVLLGPPKPGPGPKTEARHVPWDGHGQDFPAP
jgi:hypothetical protein